MKSNFASVSLRFECTLNEIEMQLTFWMDGMKHTENESNQIGTLLNLRLVIGSQIEICLNQVENMNETNINCHRNDVGGDSLFENPVVKVLGGFPNVSIETIRKIRFVFCETITFLIRLHFNCLVVDFRESDIMQKDLSALSTEDLELFGVEDAATRRELITKFGDSPNQVQHYDMYVFE